MTPEQIFARLDGIMGFSLGSVSGGGTTARQGNQNVEEWVRAIKNLLRSPNYRYLDDYEFAIQFDVDADGPDTITPTDATHVIAACVENIALAAEASWVLFADADTDTFSGAAALDNDATALVLVETITTTGVSEFYPIIWFGGSTNTGLALGTGLTISADGVDGADPENDALRAWVLYRT